MAVSQPLLLTPTGLVNGLKTPNGKSLIAAFSTSFNIKLKVIKCDILTRRLDK